MTDDIVCKDLEAVEAAKNIVVGFQNAILREIKKLNSKVCELESEISQLKYKELLNINLKLNHLIKPKKKPSKKKGIIKKVKKKSVAKKKVTKKKRAK